MDEGRVASLLFPSMDDLYGRIRSWFFLDTISCPLVHGLSLGMLATRCAMCHNLIDKLMRLVIFSRSMPRIAFWLVASFQIPKLTAYK